jgi:Ca2+-binding EF-hand superfamily protein
LSEVISKAPANASPGKNLDSEWKKMIAEIDKNSDGKISKNEFKKIFFNTNGK